jgi:hypothetical protein
MDSNKKVAVLFTQQKTKQKNAVQSANNIIHRYIRKTYTTQILLEI